MRALVVGKNERDRTWESGRLRRAGFEVVATGDGVAALRVARMDPPQLIVTNHVVGRVDVRDLLARLRRDPTTAAIPILLIAPSAASGLASACRELGATVLVRRSATQVTLAPARGSLRPMGQSQVGGADLSCARRSKPEEVGDVAGMPPRKPVEMKSGMIRKTRVEAASRSRSSQRRT